MDELWNNLDKNVEVKFLKDIIEAKDQNVLDLIEKFKCDRLDCLSEYLRDSAIKDVKINLTSVYLVIDTKENLIMGYFALKANTLIHKIDNETIANMKLQQPWSKDFFDNTDINSRKLNVHSTTPCVEISQFALNDLYLDIIKESYGICNGFGGWIYNTVIVPMIVVLSRLIGATLVILFAYKDDDNKVIESYKRMGFTTLTDDDLELFPTTCNLQPLLTYSEKRCIFMFQTTNDICNSLREQ